MNKNEFKIGDLVKIVRLGSGLNGVIGHSGKIIKIDNYNNEPYYEIDPYCEGRCWPARCLKLIDDKKPVNKLVVEPINDLLTNTSEFLDRKHKNLLLL